MIFVTIGNILIFVAVCFTFVGILGVYRFKDFYSKLMASSKIDTVAMVTLILGVAFRNGLSWFTLKALLILAFIMFINPIITSKVALSVRKDELLQLEEEKERGGAHGN